MKNLANISAIIAVVLFGHLQSVLAQTSGIETDDMYFSSKDKEKEILAQQKAEKDRLAREAAQRQNAANSPTETYDYANNGNQNNNNYSNSSSSNYSGD